MPSFVGETIKENNIVKKLNDINRFIQYQKERYSVKEIKRIIDRVKGDVTK